MGACFGIMDDEQYDKLLSRYNQVETIFQQRILSQQQQIYQLVHGKTAAELTRFERRQLSVLDKSVELMQILYTATFKQRTQLHDVRTMVTTTALLGEISGKINDTMKDITADSLTKIYNGLQRVGDHETELMVVIDNISRAEVNESEVDAILQRYNKEAPPPITSTTTSTISSAATNSTIAGDNDEKPATDEDDDLVVAPDDIPMLVTEKASGSSVSVSASSSSSSTAISTPIAENADSVHRRLPVAVNVDKEPLLAKKPRVVVSEKHQ